MTTLQEKMKQLSETMKGALAVEQESKKERDLIELQQLLEQCYKEYGIVDVRRALMNSGFWLTQVPAEIMRGNFEEGYFNNNGERL